MHKYANPDFEKKYARLTEEEKFYCVLRWLTLLYDRCDDSEMKDYPCNKCKYRYKCPNQDPSVFYLPSYNFLVLERFTGRGTVQANGSLPDDPKNWAINDEPQSKEDCWRPFD
jgi:hypothetical protein